MRGRGGGFNISPTQQDIRNFFKIVSSGPHLANQCVTMVKALASVHVCNSGPTTKLLVLRLDILKITNPKPVTKLYGNCKADATNLC